MHHLQKMRFSEDIKSLPYINLSMIKSLYPKDVETFSNWNSFSHEQRHQRHHHNRMMHQVKNSLPTNVKDSNIASAIFSSPGNISNHFSTQMDTNEYKAFNYDQVGQLNKHVISLSTQLV